MEWVFVLAIAGSVLAATAYVPPKTVGVVVLLDDAQTAGELEGRIEAVMRDSVLIKTRTADEMGANAPPLRLTSSGPDASTRKRADELFEEASAAYDEDREAAAIEKLTALSALIDKDASFPVVDRVKLRLWKTAIYLLTKDEEQAKVDAVAALALQPDLVVDSNVFPPSVSDFVEKMRKEKRVAQIQVKTSPTDATLSLDGNPVERDFKVLAERLYLLTVSARGRRTVSRSIETKGDQTIRIRLPMALPAAGETALAKLARSEAHSAELAAAVRKMSASFGVDSLVAVVAQTAGDKLEVRPTVILLGGGGTVVAGSPRTIELKEASSIATWARRVLERGPLTEDGAIRPLGGVAGAEIARRGIFGVTVDSGAGTEILQRSRSLSGSEGNGARASFIGVGPAAWAEVARGRLYGGASAGWSYYGLATTRIPVQGAPDPVAGGGSTVRSEVFVAYRHPLGAVAGGPRVGVEVAFRHERHEADDVESMHVLTSYSRQELVARLVGTVPLALAGRRWTVRAQVGTGPWSRWREDPDGATGSDPRASLPLEAGLSVDVERGRWRGGLAYRFERRAVDFSGEALAPFLGRIEDAHVVEAIQGIGVTIAWSY